LTPSLDSNLTLGKGEEKHLVTAKAGHRRGCWDVDRLCIYHTKLGSWDPGERESPGL